MTNFNFGDPKPPKVDERLLDAKESVFSLLKPIAKSDTLHFSTPNANFCKIKFVHEKSSNESEIEFIINDRGVHIKFIQIFPNGTGIGSQIIGSLIEIAKKYKLEKIFAVNVVLNSSRDIWKKLGFKFVQGREDMMFLNVDSEEAEKIESRKMSTSLNNFFDRIKEKKKDPYGLIKLKSKGKMHLNGRKGKFDGFR